MHVLCRRRLQRPKSGARHDRPCPCRTIPIILDVPKSCSQHFLSLRGRIAAGVAGSRVRPITRVLRPLFWAGEGCKFSRAGSYKGRRPPANGVSINQCCCVDLRNLGAPYERARFQKLRSLLYRMSSIEREPRGIAKTPVNSSSPDIQPMHWLVRERRPHSRVARNEPKMALCSCPGLLSMAWWS